MSPKRLPALTCLLIAAASLVGCATAGSDPPVNGCALLPLADYSRAEQERVAREIEQAPADAAWPDWITGYGKLRAQVRACAGSR